VRKLLVITLFAALSMAAGATIAGASEFGGGIHYLRNLGEIDKDQTLDLNRNSVGIIASLKKPLAMLSLDLQAEYISNYAGTDNSMWIPSAWALFGNFLYGGAGIGIGHIDGDWQSDPFYALRAGVNMPLGTMHLDVYGTYQFWNDDDLKNLTGEDLDSVTLAAVLRFKVGK